uniref:hypothetical protein n=1 Tax=Escherichia coli TaxID=562 RepID=UPI001BC86D75
KTMILSVFITVISGHDKPQPPGCLLDAQEKRRQAELRLDENRFNQLQNLAKIYLEFGGASTFP